MVFSDERFGRFRWWFSFIDVGGVCGMWDLESGDGFVFKFDSDGVDLFWVVDVEYYVFRDFVKVGIEFGLVV